jgi:Ni/Fe-hydrogenase 1 B-type cytochrome subunit
VTGVYIHLPFISVYGYETPYLMGILRAIHYIIGTIFMFCVLLRIYWFIIGNNYASFRGMYNPFSKKDWKLYFDYIKYYIFLKKDVPHVLGHNPVAVSAYIVLFLLFIFQIISGFALWGLYHQTGVAVILFGWVFSLVDIQWVRFYHYIFMYLVAGFFINHIFSAVLFDFKTQSGEISAIFAGWKPLRRD